MTTVNRSAASGIDVWGPLCLLVALVACDDVRAPPPRPLLVRREAAWAPGDNGAAPAWVDCVRVADAQAAVDGRPHPELDDRFECAVYDAGGAIQQKGRFRLVDVHDDGSLWPTTAPRALLSFVGAAAHRIVVGGARLLVDERHLTCDAGGCTAR